MLAYPTPLPGAADALQRRQLDSIISSVLNGGTGGTTADTGAGTTANGGGSAGDTTAVSSELRRAGTCRSVHDAD